MQVDRTSRSRWSWKIALVALAACVALPLVARAEDESQDDEQQARSEFSALWNVDQLMERAANNIARRYNLNEKQRKDTHEMLVRETSKFLEEHGEIWPLVRDLARMQQAGEQPSGKVAQRLAEKATPLLRDIEDTIIEANMRWREILTPEQKRMHDYDLQDMAKTFDRMNDNFRTMAEGGPGVAEIFPSPNQGAKQPARPPLPPPDYKPPQPIPVTNELASISMWDRYVENFIRDFRLDDQQSEAARSILKECKQRAEDYRRSKRQDFEQVQSYLNDANQADRSPEARTAMLRVATKIRDSLNRPIHELFNELQTRLEPIPTEAQRAHARKLGRDVGPARGSEPARRVEPKKSAEPAPKESPAAEAEKPADAQAAPAQDANADNAKPKVKEKPAKADEKDPTPPE
ncbi:MAG TPA: hypothetical protein P5572_03650 [Phycisphaerae bacterium]|nr:hypothetical protein [Phycisphaerae bacterium]